MRFDFSNTDSDAIESTSKDYLGATQQEGNWQSTRMTIDRIARHKVVIKPRDLTQANQIKALYKESGDNEAWIASGRAHSVNVYHINMNYLLQLLVIDIVDHWWSAIISSFYEVYYEAIMRQS